MRRGINCCMLWLRYIIDDEFHKPRNLNVHQRSVRLLMTFRNVPWSFSQLWVLCLTPCDDFVICLEPRLDSVTPAKQWPFFSWFWLFDVKNVILAKHFILTFQIEFSSNFFPMDIFDILCCFTTLTIDVFEKQNQKNIMENTENIHDFIGVITKARFDLTSHRSCRNSEPRICVCFPLLFLPHSDYWARWCRTMAPSAREVMARENRMEIVM